MEKVSTRGIVVSALAAGAIAGLFFFILKNKPQKAQVKKRKSIKKEIQMQSVESNEKSVESIQEKSLELENAQVQEVQQVKDLVQDKVQEVEKPEIKDDDEGKDNKTLAAEAKAKGNKFFTSQRYTEAIEMYSQAIHLNPDPIYYSNRAACYSMLKDYENVVQDCSMALQMDRKYVKALSRRALAYEHLGKLDQALNDYTAVCVLEEFKNESSLGATDRFLKKIATEQAQEIMKTKEFTLPSDTFIRAFLDSFRQTSTGLNEVLEMQTFEKCDGLVQDAFRFIQERNWNSALSSVNQALESAVDSLSPPFEALALNLRGTFNFLIGKVDEAIEDIEKSYSIDSTSINTIIKKATLYMEKAQVEKSVEIFDEAVQLDPNHPDVFYHRGQVRFLVGDFAGAASDYKKAISLDPENLYAFIQLGVAQYKLGETERTKKTFEKALKKFPNSHEIHNYYGEILLDQQKFDQGTV